MKGNRAVLTAVVVLDSRHRRLVAVQAQQPRTVDRSDCDLRYRGEEARRRAVPGGRRGPER